MILNPILDNEILSPKKLLDKLNLKVEDNIKIDNMSWDEFEDMFPDIWTYPLSEITHLIENGIYVYICKFSDGTVRYIENQEYCDDNEPLYPRDFHITVSYDQDSNSLVINSEDSIGIRYYLTEKSDLGLRVQNYVDIVISKEGEKINE